MQIREIITESIRYAKHIHEVSQVIQHGIAEAIKHLGPKPYEYSSIYEPYRNEVNREKGDSAISKKLKAELGQRLSYFVGQKLQNIATKIILADSNAYIPVSFKPMPDGGQADSLSVSLNTRFIEQLTERVYDAISNGVWKNWSGDEDSYYDWFWNYIRKTDFSEEIQGSRIDSVIKHWASIFIHELVHVRQHLPQKQRGRESIEYRSYLDNFKGEFLNLHFEEGAKDERTERWWDLYSASPQEIAARAHQAAITILDYYIRYPEDIEYLDAEELRQIVRKVPEFIEHSYFRKPKTPNEQQVYRRYIRKTIEQIIDYIEHYKSVK